MIRSQNAALYSGSFPFPTRSRGTKLARVRSCAEACDQSRRWIKLVPIWIALVALVCWLPGCKQPAQPNKKSGSSGSVAADKPVVPLRVWFVGEEEGQTLLQRQWQATYDRPLELRMLTKEQLAKETRCDCDVLVFPALMLGELISRDWLAALPSALQPPNLVQLSSDTPSTGASSNTSSRDLPIEPQPAAWLEQARYGKQAWGLSLSVATPVVMANFDLPELPTVRANQEVTSAASQAYWQSLIDSLAAAQGKASAAGRSTTDDKTLADVPDADALCDRFLVISTSISNREPRFGMLFDPENLQPRLSDESFAIAAGILRQLQQAGASFASLVGDNAVAWNALSGEQPDVTIGFPPPASAEVDKLTTIQVSQPPTTPARAGARTTAGWNSGRGLLVSISSQCRQTGPSIDFARWIASENSRNSFSKRLHGFASESAYAPGSSAWNAQRLVQRLGQQARLPSEPRFPASLQYRRALGEQLVKLLRGEQTEQEALDAAADRWRLITAELDQTQHRRAYEQSLGL